MPAIHVFNARLKEQIGDRYGARAAYLWSDDESSSHFIEKAINEANMEKRLVCNQLYAFSRSGVWS